MVVTRAQAKALRCLQVRIYLVPHRHRMIHLVYTDPHTEKDLLEQLIKEVREKQAAQEAMNGSSAQPSASHDVEIMGDLLCGQLTLPLVTVLKHIPSLKVMKDKPEGENQKVYHINITRETDNANVIVPVAYKAFPRINEIVDGGSGVNIIFTELYHEWNIGPLEESSFMLKLADQRSTKPRGILRNLPIRIGGLSYNITVVVMDLPYELQSYCMLLQRPWLRLANVVYN